MTKKPDRPLQCPTCKRAVQKEGNPDFPFCAERCRIIDLGAWLDERYYIAGSDSMSESDLRPEDPPDS